jgi:hypothetical protein
MLFDPDILPNISWAPARVWIYEDTAREEILSRIHASRVAATVDFDVVERYGNSVLPLFRLSEVEAFYVPPFEIAGFRMFGVSLSDQSFIFHYALIDVLNSVDLRSIPDTGFHLSEALPSEYRMRILIDRPESSGRNVDAATDLKNASEANSNPFTEDNFLYLGAGGIGREGDLWGQIGENHVLRITASGRFSSYRFLRDLAFEVIRTAEFVVAD